VVLSNRKTVWWKIGQATDMRQYRSNKPIQSLMKSPGKCRLSLLIATILILPALMAGCEQDRPDDLIDEETYLEILLEMHLLAALREMDGGDEKRFLAGQKAVLDHYQITRDQFQRSHAWYHRNMHEQQARYTAVRNRMEELGSDLSDRYMEMRDTLKNPHAP
jgi:hypothetical protein